MLLPDLSTLSLSPAHVADVGGHYHQPGDQCDPREQDGGVCVVLAPMPHILAQARLLLPAEILNEDAMALAFRVQPSSSKWTEETPYDTLHASEQYRAFCTILGYVPPIALGYRRDDGQWLALTREDGTWAELVRKKIIRTHPSETRPQQFWTRFRYQLSRGATHQLAVAVLNAMHTYNARHQPVWQKVDAERRGLAAALAAAREDREREARAMAMAARVAAARAPAPSPAPARPTPGLAADEPFLDEAGRPLELPSMEEVLNDEFVKSLLRDADSEVPEFVV